MTNNNNTIYGDPNNIDVFEAHDRKKEINSARSKGKSVEKMFNGDHGSIVYEMLTKNISSIEPNQVVTAIIEGETNTDILLSYPGIKDNIRVEKSKKENTFFEGKVAGDEVELLIVQLKDNPYMIKGSIASLYEQTIKNTIKNSPKENEPVEALIKELTPAGYNMEVYYDGIKLPGFMPNTLAGVNKLHDPYSIVGQQMKVVIESFAEDKGTYIVSRRKYLQTLIWEETKKLRYDVAYTGHVTGSTQFGIFIEFNGCLTGMIHKTNINPEWQDRMHEIKPGMEIDFYVKEIIKDKIILTQIIKESLWDTLKSGQKMIATVKDTKSFGVLVKLDDETMALIHNSEMEKGNLKKLDNGAKVEVKVLAIDRSNRKIFLGIA